VWTLATSVDGSRVFAGGIFATVAGVARANVVALDSTTGGVVADWHPDPGKKVFGLATNDTTVYAAVGGSANSLYAWDATTGSQKWRKTSDGDFQAVAVSRGIVYAGGHFNNVEGELRRKLVAVDADTGALRRDWSPKLPHTTATWYGVVALSTYADTRLAVGGDFDNISGFRQEHYAQFTGSIGGAAGDTTPPTTPTGLTATAMGGGRVELAWSASTDDDGVAEYRILRDGAQIAVTGTPLFSDTTVAASTTSSYRVVAVDFAGNASAASPVATATTAAPDELRTFIASEDTYIDAGQPDANFGSAASVKVDASPKLDLLLKFAVAGLGDRRILGAKLRLYSTDSSNNGGDFRRVSDTSWGQSTVTWNNAPAGDSVVLGTLDDVSSKNWYELDVTPLVRGDGTVSVRASSPSSNAAGFSSTEGSAANRPQLVVTLAAEGADVPPAPLFSDGVETGDLSRWSEDGGLAVRRSDPFSGAWAVRATSTGQATHASKSLRVSETELSYQQRFKVISQENGTVSLLKFRTGTGASLIRLFRTTGGKLATRNHVTGISTTSSTAVAAGSWHTGQMRVRVNDTASEVDVWLNGDKIDDLSGTTSLGTTPIGRLELGDEATGKSYDLLFEDSTAAIQAIADETSPTAPTGLTATASSATAVELAWEPASDDLGVTEYEIHRDGALLATVGSVTTHTDTTVSEATSYTYTVKAKDAAGNTSPASEPANVTTPELDKTAPSAPVVAVTVVSFDRVDVSWSGSVDEVGVSEYRVYRDGELLGTVDGARAVYRDTSVASSTRYEYVVEAVDAAGNVSHASAAVVAVTPGWTVFLEGFESGDLSQWSGGAGLAVEGGDAFAGGLAARATTGGSAMYGYKELSSGRYELYYGVRFKVVSQADSFALLKFRTASGSSVARLWLTSAGRLAIRNDVMGVATQSLTAVTAGWWHTVKVRVLVDGAASRIDVWFDGAQVDALSGSQSLGTSPVGRVQLGDDATGKSYDVRFDEVAVDVPPANTAPPTISGTAEDGQALSADRGSWSGTEPIAYAYQWRRCDTTGAGCVDIEGATEQRYALTSADVDSTIRVRVTASNAAASATAGSEATSAVAAVAPANTARPTISGTVEDGQSLTADPGAWSGTEPIAYGYQWRRCDDAGGGCADIEGATGQSYRLTSADVGFTIRVAVTASNAAGSGSMSSEPSDAVVAAAPANVVAPTVSGAAEDGQSLTADPGTWSGTEPLAYAYQWRRCDTTGGGCADIAGATGPSYTLGSADVGSTIRVRVMASNAAGESSASSEPTAPVAAVAPANTAPPTISGTPKDGEILSADRGSWSGTEPIPHAYQWQRCQLEVCNDILDATEQSYTVTSGDVDFAIRVMITASNAVGTTSAASHETAAVVAAAPVNTAAPTISGAARDGETLVADRGSWSGTEPLAYAYQWRRCDDAGAACVDIDGATEQTYTLTGADVGSTIRVTVTASNAAGQGSASSAPTMVVATP
jgi:hypothetical protein